MQSPKLTDNVALKEILIFFICGKQKDFCKQMSTADDPANEEA